jgi:hypothetical protein
MSLPENENKEPAKLKRLRRSPTFVLYCALDEIRKRYLQNRFFSGLLIFAAAI